jgi:hypothetical protein
MPARAAVALSTLCLAGALGLAACGGSSHPVSSATTAAAPTVTPALTTATSATTTPATTAPTTATLTGGGGGTFCAEARSSSARSIEAAGRTDSKPSLAQSFAEIKKIGPRLVSEAPTSIRPAMASLIHFDLQFYGMLAQAGYDYAKIPPAQLATIQSETQTLDADATTISNYFRDTCGVALGTSATT